MRLMYSRDSALNETRRMAATSGVISPADGTGIHTHSTTSGPVFDGTVNLSNRGELGIGVGIITFPSVAASTGTASLVMTIVSGGSLRINTTGNAMATHTEAPPAGPYSFTNTTFTFTPTAGLAPPLLGSVVYG